MAEVQVNIKVNNPDLNPLKELKKELLAAKGAALNGDGAAAKRVAELSEKMKELKEQTKTLQGGGVEPLKNSFSLLTEGFTSGEYGKVTTGLKGIGKAMSAIPIFLLIEGVRFLVENFKEIVAFGKEVFDSFVDEERAVRTLTKELDALKIANSLVTGELKREIAELEASGASHAKIIAKKQELIEVQKQEAIMSAKLNLAKIKEVMANDSIYESTLKLMSAGLRKVNLDAAADVIDRKIEYNKKERNAENVKALAEGMGLIKDLESQSRVITLTEDKKVNDVWKKTNDDKKAQAIKDAEYYRKRRLEDDAWDLQADKDLAEQKKVIDVEERDLKAEALNESLMKYTEDLAERKRLRAEEMKDIKDGLTNTAVGIQTISSLNDTLFSIKSANTKKGSKEDEEAARKHFQMNKALQLGTAVVNGAQSVLAITSVPDFTLGIASALRIAAQVALTAKVIATIASAKFQPSGGGGSVGGGGSIGGGPIPSPQQQEVPQPRQQSTEFDNEGNKKGGAIVLVSEINETQRSLARVKEQARF